MQARHLLSLPICSMLTAFTMVSCGNAPSANPAPPVGDSGALCAVGLVEAPPFVESEPLCAVTLVEVPPFAEPWIR